MGRTQLSGTAVAARTVLQMDAASLPAGTPEESGPSLRTIAQAPAIMCVQVPECEQSYGCGNAASQAVVE